MRSATRLSSPASSPTAASSFAAEEHVLRLVIASGCAYEVAALIAGWGGKPTRLPTLSRLCRKHRWLEVLLFSWLVAHFHYQRKAASIS